MPSCQTVFGPQDPLLRCRAVPLLRLDQGKHNNWLKKKCLSIDMTQLFAEWRERVSSGWLLLQREALPAKVQCQLHHDHAPLPKERLRKASHRLQWVLTQPNACALDQFFTTYVVFRLPAVQGGKATRNARETSVRPWPSFVPFILEVRHTRIRTCQQEKATGKMS